MTKAPRNAALLTLGAIVTSIVLAIASPVARSATGSFVQIHLDGVINPLKVRHVTRALEKAQQERAEFLLVTIDTPGGLVTSLQELTVALANSPVPVIGYVAPEGAQATSAGAFVLLATDIAAMAPSTRVGAAHPVGGEGKSLDEVMDEKATNSLASLARSLAERRARPTAVAESMVRESKSFTEKEAHEARLVEILAVNREHLLRELEGRTLAFRGRTLTLRAKGLTPIVLPMSRLDRILDTIANPTIASLLLTLGVLGLLYELSSPGVGMGGIVGAVCLLVGLLGVSVLPIELGALLLLVVGLAAIGLEIAMPSHGLLAGGGVVALVLGAMFLVDSGDYFGGIQRVNALLFAPLAAALVTGLVLLARLTRRALKAPFATGESSLVGKRGVVKVALEPEGSEFSGMVFVDGARWRAVSTTAIAHGEPVVVEEVLRGPARLRVIRSAD